MKNCNLLAIDLGSSSARVMLVKVDGNGEFVFDELARFSHSPQLAGDVYRWDITTLFVSLKNAIDIAIQKYNIASIGICSWGVDYGLIDKCGKLFDQPICYRDSRGAVAFDMLHEGKCNLPNKQCTTMSKQQLFEKSGIYPNPINTLYQLVADKMSCRYQDSDGLKFVLIADLLAYHLCGQLFAEKSNASTTGLLSKDGNDWNFELIDELGLDKNIFPTLIDSGKAYGNYKGIAVKAVCTHDTASAVFGMGNLDERSIFISSGSWMLVGTLCKKPIVSTQVFEAEYTNERGFNNSVTLLSNMNGLFVIQRLVAELGITYKQIDEQVAGAKCLGIVDTNSLTSPNDMIGQIKSQLKELLEKKCSAEVDNAKSNILCKNSNKNGNVDCVNENAITRQNIDNASPMDLIKTAYDSLAFNITKAISQLESVVNEKFNKVVISGGMSKAPYLMKQFKKLCNLEICISSSEGAIVGNAKAQLV